MMLASRLGMSVARCKRETGPRQFIKWLRFIQEKDAAEIEKTEKWEYYAAELFSLVRGACGQKVEAGKLLLKFKSQRSTVPKVSDSPPVTKEQRIKEAKAFWGAFFAAHKGVKQSVKGK